MSNTFIQGKGSTQQHVCVGVPGGYVFGTTHECLRCEAGCSFELLTERFWFLVFPSFHPLTLPCSWLDFLCSLPQGRGDTAEMPREKGWILGFEFQKLRLRMTPRAGEKKSEVGGEWGKGQALERPCGCERTQGQPPPPRELRAADPRELSGAELTPADGPVSVSPPWLQWFSHGQQQEPCPLTSPLEGARLCPWEPPLSTFQDIQAPAHRAWWGQSGVKGKPQALSLSPEPACDQPPSWECRYS